MPRAVRLGQQHREERDRPEDRRAVDDDQQDQDDQRGHAEQRAVDVAEDLDRVELVAGAAPVTFVVSPPCSPLTRARIESMPRLEAVARPRCPDTGSRTGPRRRCARTRASAAGGRSRGGLRREDCWSFATRLRSAAVSPPLRSIDDDGGRQLAAGIALDGLERLDRLGLAGEEGGRLVLLRVLELAREEPADDRRDDEEDGRDHELGPPAGGNGEDRAIRRSVRAAGGSLAQQRLELVRLGHRPLAHEALADVGGGAAVDRLAALEQRHAVGLAARQHDVGAEARRAPRARARRGRVRRARPRARGRRGSRSPAAGGRTRRGAAGRARAGAGSRRARPPRSGTRRSARRAAAARARPPTGRPGSGCPRCPCGA